LSTLRHTVQRLRIGIWILAATILVVALWMWFERLPFEEKPIVHREGLLVSIPIVALFFTWFHIWLAIKMMFLPLRFVGLWQYKTTGIGIGWQGVVPRKCEKMARTAYACARPFLLSVGDWLSSVQPEILMKALRPKVEEIVSSALDIVAERHFPDVDRTLPASVREELAEEAVGKIEEHFGDLWREFQVLLCNPEIGIDNDGMVVSIFVDNKELLNHFFLELGRNEYRFIERCGAALGFVCGVIQLLAYNHLDDMGRAILLPGTGFFLGIFTNWLAILVCFKPVWPHPIRICGYHVCTLQGLFLKRQKDVAVQYSKLLCDHFFDFNKVVAYLQSQPELWSKLKAAYLDHNARVFQKTLGPVVGCFAPFAIGRHRFRELQADLIQTLVDKFSKADELHRMAGTLIAEETNIFRANSISMQRMPPDKFEDLLHPVFKEDEWILILLGGILGAIVGAAQVYFLAE